VVAKCRYAAASAVVRYGERPQSTPRTSPMSGTEAARLPDFCSTSIFTPRRTGQVHAPRPRDLLRAGYVRGRFLQLSIQRCGHHHVGRKAERWGSALHHRPPPQLHHADGWYSSWVPRRNLCQRSLGYARARLALRPLEATPVDVATTASMTSSRVSHASLSS
jgi:hypothetical protein